MSTMLTINQAIRQNRKITFRYQKYTIRDRTQQVDRRGGATYKISPLCGIKKNKSPVQSYVIAEGLKMGLNNAILSVN